MSYYAEVMKDTPYSFYMLDNISGANAPDTAGAGRTGTNTGTLTKSIPFIGEAAYSTIYTASTYTTISFPYAIPGQERQSFTMEAWVFLRSQASLPIMRAPGAQTGLYVQAGAFRFGLNLSGGSVFVEYKPTLNKLIHLVGVYNSTSLQLFANGELIGTRALSADEMTQSITVPFGSGTMLMGQGEILMQAAATYQYALSKERIDAHYAAGMVTSTSDITSRIYGGKYLEVSQRTVSTFFTKEWTTDWSNGYSDALTDGSLTPKLDEVTGLPVASSWQGLFELESGGTSIEGVQITWEGTGTFVIETSLDGFDWAATTNQSRVAGIASGFDTTDQLLMVRVRFTDGAVGEVTRLQLVGFKSLIVQSPNIPIVIPSDTLIYPTKEIKTLSMDNGFEPQSGVVAIGPSTEESAPGIKSMTFWYYQPTGAAFTLTFSGGTYYINGGSSGYTVRNDQWVFVMISTPTAITGTINLTAVGTTLAYVSVYENQLTQAQANQIYRGYLGTQIVSGSTTSDTLVSITDQAATLRGTDWSIQPAG